MPVYTYRCENCGVQFERQQRFSDRQLTRCPECDKKTLHRVYRPVGIVFKGSGFYATDNRSKSAASLPPKSEAKKEEGTSKAADKAEKSESKTSSKEN